MASHTDELSRLSFLQTELNVLFILNLNTHFVFPRSECLKSLMKEDGLSEEECKKTVARRIELGSVDLSLDPLLKSACAMDLTKVNA